MRFNHRNVGLEWSRDGSPRATTVLMLHGLSGISTGYDEVVDDLGDGADVFRLDLRGHGRSDRAPGTYSVPFYSDDVVAFIEEVIAEPVVLVGHSLGGVITHHITATRPDLVAVGVVRGSAAVLLRPEPVRAEHHGRRLPAPRGQHARGASRGQAPRVLRVDGRRCGDAVGTSRRPHECARPCRAAPTR